MIARLPAAVICDMDGLLVDSERLERRVWQAAAADHAIALDDARFASFVGHPAEVCDRMLRDYYGETFDVPAFRATCHGRMRALVASAGVSLRPGARAWLDFVRARGIPLGLATSSGPALVPERLGDLVALFSAVVTRADVARGKPHPDLYLEAAARLRVAPEAALAFEDSPTGARAALAAGMPVIIVPDLVPAPPDVAARAVGVFDSLDAVREAAARAWDGAARVAMRGLAGVLAATAIAAAAPRRTRAQMPEHDAPMAPGMSTGMQAMMTGPLGLPMTRTGSGTSWVPDSTPMYARMFDAGSWGLMFHGVAFGQYDHQGGPRGASQVGSVNWGMLMAAHNLGRATADGGGTGGRLELRGMLSLEPFTVGARGYPLLLQTGEAYHGRPLHDRQHPHDLFMELAALYERPLAPDLGLQLYAAPVGEPALGPVAFPHRPSAAADPFATLGHHWEDATHISFGVLTAGLFTRVVKLEGSVFNGREPDDVRTNFDYRGRSLDSY
ncbi:MAG TPA: HAD family phosphatase, partial [Gemmatirosa sp.]